MTGKMERRTGLLLSAVCFAVAMGAMPATAQEELRIGFIAPITGPFAQVGKDMTDGFNMYLEQANGMLGGTKVKVIFEDSQAKPDTAVTKAKKLVLEDHVQMFLGGVLASEGYALAPVSTAEKTVYISPVAAADDLTQRQLGNYPYFIRTGWIELAAATIRTDNGPATRATRRSPASPPITPSATSRSAVSRRPSRIAAARSSRRSGRRSAPRISVPSSRPSRPMPTRCFR